MTHMVIYRSSEGQPVYHQTESLEEAARHLEHLRNAGQGSDARIFSMQEVRVEVKTYYKVELPSETAAAAAAPAPTAPPAAPATPAAPAAAAAAAPATPTAAPAAPTAPAAPASAPAASPQPVKGEPAGAGANGGRFGLFGKS